MRTLAIGDIHGCLSALDHLLNFVKPATEDLIITLGDHVDRGPDTQGVLDRLIALHKQRKMVSLLGNHELLMLTALEGKAEARQWLTHGGSEALESYRQAGKHVSLADVPSSHWGFMETNCQHYFETLTHIFVHANLLPRVDMPEQPELILCWESLNPRKYEPHYSGKTMICGHTAQKKGNPLVLPGAICIDTWAYGDGWLTCLDVDSGQYWQANELGETRIGSIPRVRED